MKIREKSSWKNRGLVSGMNYEGSLESRKKSLVQTLFSFKANGFGLLPKTQSKFEGKIGQLGSLKMRSLELEIKEECANIKRSTKFLILNTQTMVL